MARKTSAGLLIYRRRAGGIEVLLVHPGGPFWRNKDEGAWSIPKGEFAEGEHPLDAAKRELGEETGLHVEGDFRALTPVKQKSGKTIFAFAIEAEPDISSITSNSFALEWPPKSGRIAQIPEVDRAAWFAPDEAQRKLHAGQRPLLDELAAFLRL
jgi:predicted NUDIX family NTP pyrophosphohydrolase